MQIDLYEIIFVLKSTNVSLNYTQLYNYLLLIGFCHKNLEKLVILFHTICHVSAKQKPFPIFVYSTLTLFLIMKAVNNVYRISHY